MSVASKHLYTWLAFLLPALGISALVVRAEVAVRSGPSFRIPIRGYDPRDLFHGRYLQYQFDFDWQGEDSCPAQWNSQKELADTRAELEAAIGPRARPEHLVANCCLCLTRTQAGGFNPQVRQVDCEESRSDCDGWIRSHELMPPLRFFVPEDKAQELEEALRAQRPSIEFTATPSGTVAIKELYLNESPWRLTRGVGKDEN